MSRILIVDDEKLLAQALATELKLEGFDCHCTHTVAEAEEQLAKGGYQVVISDIKMPHRQGTDLLSKTKLPVILMSAFSAVTRDEALEMGAVDLLTKPFAVDDLLKLIRETLSS